MTDDDQIDSGSRLLKAIEAIAISAEDAKALVLQLQRKARKVRPQSTDREIEDSVAEQLINRYAKLSATSGGLTALTAVVPGIGTALAMVGGGLADTLLSLKFQVDMVMCLAENFGWDLTNEDAKHLSYLIAATGSLEKFGVEGITRIASKAGVGMLKQYLKGAALVTVKQAFKKVSINFTRIALEKAIPFGFGVFIGATANYGLTKYVGVTAMNWFLIERDSDNRDGPGDGPVEPTHSPSGPIVDTGGISAELQMAAE